MGIGLGLGLWCLTSLSTIFQYYCGSQFFLVSLNPIHGEVYSIQLYVIKFVRGLLQVGSFLWVLQISPPKKTDCHNSTEILSDCRCKVLDPNETHLYQVKILFIILTWKAYKYRYKVSNLYFVEVR
jgi:hypothetical protein